MTMLAAFIPILAASASADQGMTSLGTIFTQFMSWMNELYSVIVAHPIMMLTLGIFVVGAAIGLIFRLIRG